MIFNFSFSVSLINTKVFSSPVDEIYNPESGTTSFAATWHNLMRDFTSSGNYASTFEGVWIGGTPDSWRIKELFHFSGLIKSRYLSSVSIPFSNIFFNLKE